jgi:hypothetical protein
MTASAAWGCPSLARQPIAGLRGRKDLGEIVRSAWRTYFANFGPLFSIALITAPVQMLSGVALSRTSDAATQQLITSAFAIPQAIVTIVATAALIHAVNEIAEGRKPEFGASVDAALSRFFTVLTTNLLAGVLALLSVIFAPYFVVRWTFSAQAVMIEGKRNWAALDASSSIVKGNWWRTFGIMLVIVLIAVGPSIIAGPAGLLPPLAAATIVGLVIALTIPFLVTGQTLLYYDLKARKEPDAGTDGVPPAEPDLPREGA